MKLKQYQLHFLVVCTPLSQSVGLYTFGSGGVLVSKSGAEMLTAEQYKEALANRNEYNSSFVGQLYSWFDFKFAKLQIFSQKGYYFFTSFF